MASAVSARLVALGVNELLAFQASNVSGSVEEALDLLGRTTDGSPAANGAKDWKECFCEKNQRYYYYTPSRSQWEAPLCFRFREWALDAELYGISLPLARDVYIRVDALLARHSAAVARRALATLATLLENVAACDNGVEKYRSVKTANPKFAAAVWDVAGAREVLAIAGFKLQGDTVEIGVDAALGPLRAAAARCRRYADGRGHSGSAGVLKADSANGSGRPPSPLYGSEGFTYQEQIWHCSCCDHPINDGSERLWTGSRDSPHGEFRFRCETCQPPAAAFNLCQDCWDRHVGGEPQHDPAHTFSHVGPRMTRHNDYYGTNASGASGSNPWGSGGTGAGYSRGLARMRERYGIHSFGG